MKNSGRSFSFQAPWALVVAMLVAVSSKTQAAPSGHEAHAPATGATHPVETRGVSAPTHAEDPYAPFAFLIGEWDTPGGIRQSLRWGPRKSYIWYAVYMRAPGAAEEDLHQEGLMTFNGKEKDLDFLFVHDPGSFNQEQGKVHVEPDGSVVRETTAIYADGSITHFRQTWRQTGPDTAITSLLRQADDGTWVPNFPGADQMEMKRRPS